jgi:anti-sigma B factor antagonist
VELKVEFDSNIIFMKMVGSLVASSAEGIKAQVQKLVDKKYVHIVFDMTRVDFVDSSGLGLCIATSRELAASSGRLVCCGLGENVQKLFSLTRADQKIKTLPTRSDAFDFMLALVSDKSADSLGPPR